MPFKSQGLLSSLCISSHAGMFWVFRITGTNYFLKISKTKRCFCSQINLYVFEKLISNQLLTLFSRCFCYSIISIIRMYVIQILTVLKKVIDFNVYQKAFCKHHNTRLCVAKILYNGQIQILGMSVAQTCSLLSL